MIALLPLLFVVACKDPTPLDDFVDQMKDPDWCPTSWEDGIYEAFYEAGCRHTTNCGDSIFENCMEGLEGSSPPSTCIRGCDVRECVEWQLSDDCDYENRPQACRTAAWCE